MSWLLVVGTAVFARAAAAALLLPATGLRRQEPSVIAANLNAGLGFVIDQYGAPYHAFKEPGHIAALALLTRWAGNGDLPLLVFQALFGAATAVAAALLARRLTADPLSATLAGLLVAMNPFLVYYDSLVVHPLSVDTLLFLVTTTLNVWAVERATPGAAARAGVATGLALWQRSTLLFCGAAVWTSATVLARGARRRTLVQAGIWLAVALLVIQPWFARNYRLLGRWVYTTDIAHIVWLGNNPLSNGTYSDARGQRIFYSADPAFRARIEGAPELQQMDRFLAAAREFVREHPARAAGLALRRVWAFVWLGPNAGAEYERWQVQLYVFVYLALLSAGVIGAIDFFRRAGPTARRRALLTCAALLGLVAVHALTAINMKHRVPLEVVLAVFAAGPLAATVRRLGRNHGRSATTVQL